MGKMNLGHSFADDFFCPYDPWMGQNIIHIIKIGVGEGTSKMDSVWGIPFI